MVMAEHMQCVQVVESAVCDMYDGVLEGSNCSVQ